MVKAHGPPCWPCTISYWQQGHHMRDQLRGRRCAGGSAEGTRRSGSHTYQLQHALQVSITSHSNAILLVVLICNPIFTVCLRRHKEGHQQCQRTPSQPPSPPTQATTIPTPPTTTPTTPAPTPTPTTKPTAPTLLWRQRWRGERGCDAFTRCSFAHSNEVTLSPVSKEISRRNSANVAVLLVRNSAECSSTQTFRSTLMAPGPTERGQLWGEGARTRPGVRLPSFHASVRETRRSDKASTPLVDIKARRRRDGPA